MSAMILSLKVLLEPGEDSYPCSKLQCRQDYLLEASCSLKESFSSGSCPQHLSVLPSNYSVTPLPVSKPPNALCTMCHGPYYPLFTKQVRFHSHDQDENRDTWSWNLLHREPEFSTQQGIFLSTEGRLGPGPGLQAYGWTRLPSRPCPSVLCGESSPQLKSGGHILNVTWADRRLSFRCLIPCSKRWLTRTNEIK